MIKLTAKEIGKLKLNKNLTVKSNAVASTVNLKKLNLTQNNTQDSNFNLKQSNFIQTNTTVDKLNDSEQIKNNEKKNKTIKTTKITETNLVKKDKKKPPVKKSLKEEKQTTVKTLARQLRVNYPDCELVVEIDFAPRPKERARTFMDDNALVRAYVNSKGDTRRFMALVKGGGNKGVMKTITPENTRIFEENIKIVATYALARSELKRFMGPVEMDIDFRFLGDPDTWPTSQADGDLDNLEKAVLDGLKPVWLDDRLVVRKTACKRCALKAGITVKVRPAKP